MKSLFASFAAVAAVAAAAATAAEPPARIFDIVPPEGRRVEWVDDLTELRQPAEAGETIGATPPGGATQGQDRGGSKARRNNDQEREHDLAVAQVTALGDRLFRNETIAPKTVGRGDVRIELPPRRTDGAPAEFALTLGFGGERMDVVYRERLPGAAAGSTPAG